MFRKFLWNVAGLVFLIAGFGGVILGMFLLIETPIENSNYYAIGSSVAGALTAMFGSKLVFNDKLED